MKGCEKELSIQSKEFMKENNLMQQDLTEKV